MNDRFKSLIDKMNEDELIDLAKQTAMEISRLNKSRNRRSQNELNAHVHCSRAKRTTLYANTEKASSVLYSNIETLKYLVNRL